MYTYNDGEIRMENFSIEGKKIGSIEQIENFSEVQLLELLQSIEYTKIDLEENAFRAEYHYEDTSQKLYKILYLDLDDEVSEEDLYKYLVSAIHPTNKKNKEQREKQMSFEKLYNKRFGGFDAKRKKVGSATRGRQKSKIIRTEVL